MNMTTTKPIYIYERQGTPLIANNYLELREKFLQGFESDLANANGVLYKVLLSHQPLIKYLDSLLNFHQQSGTKLDISVPDVIDELMHVFSTSNVDPSRFDDVIDVSSRLYVKQPPHSISQPSIVASQSLLPTDLLCIPTNMILELWVKEGSNTSHVALVADSLDIPYKVLLDAQWHDISTN